MKKIILIIGICYFITPDLCYNVYNVVKTHIQTKKEEKSAVISPTKENYEVDEALISRPHNIEIKNL